MNDENLVPFSERTQREHSEIARKGAIAANKVKKEKKTMRTLLETMLSAKPTNKDYEKKLKELGVAKDDATYSALMMYNGIFAKALKGDKWAIEQVFKVTGTYAPQDVNINASVDLEAKGKEIEEFINGNN